VIVAASALLVLAVLFAVAARSGRVRTLVSNSFRFVHGMVAATLDHGAVSDFARGNYTSVVFLHHSVGKNLIEQGGMRETLSTAGIDFWDQGYSVEGLRRPDGAWAGYSYPIPNDNTDPDGLVGIFEQPVYAWPINAFSALLQHEVIVFKSCYPVSHISTDQQLETYKAYYLRIRAVMDRHQDKLFIVVSPPPLNPSETDLAAAARARAFAEWLTAPQFSEGRPNIVAFDLFGHLAENDPGAEDYGMLRATYRLGGDSHPNQSANQAVGPLLADFIAGAAKKHDEGR